MRKTFFFASVLAVILVPARPAAAEWMLTPFAGVRTHAGTGYFDPDGAITKTKLAAGLAVAKTWRRFQIEAEAAVVPGFFSTADEGALITSSRVITFTGSLVAPLPHVGPLRPYAVAGLGAVRVSMRDTADVFPVSEWQPILDVGGGVMVPLRGRTSAGVDARYFWSRRGDGSESTIGFGNTYVQFWRISARMTIR